MSFPVKMWSGLVEEKHYKVMGNSIWLYLWMLARITKEIEGKGYVLGGKPVKDIDIVEEFGTNEKTIRRWRKRLTKMSYLEGYKTPYGMVYFVNKSKKFKWGKTKVSTPLDKSVQNKLRYKEDIKDIKHSRVNKDVSPNCSPLQTKEKSKLINEIITDLNTLLKTSYKPTTKKNRELINARLEEGFTLDDFKQVHRKKIAEWGKDDKMDKYLRPITLYGTKFESYLNQKTKKKQGGDLWLSSQTK